MNSIFNFTNKLTTDTKEFINFNQLISVPSTIFETQKYFYYITVPNDTRLDILSVEAYGINIYSDLIFIINKMSSIFDLPKSESYVRGIIDEKYKYYTNTLNIKSTILLNKIYENLENKHNKENELYRNLRMVRSEYLTEVIGLIKNANNLR